MKLPSAAQAALLACVADHNGEGDEVLAGVTEGRSRVQLYVERYGRDVDARQTPMSVGLGHYGDTDILLRPASLSDAREATWRACGVRGWLVSSRSREITTRCLGVCWKGYGDNQWTVRLACCDLTDDGRIALGVWRQARMAVPPVPCGDPDGGCRARGDDASGRGG